MNERDFSRRQARQWFGPKKRLSPREQERREREERAAQHAERCKARFVKARGPVPRDVWQERDETVASWGGSGDGNAPPTYVMRTKRGALYLQIPSFPSWVFCPVVDLGEG